MAFLVNKHRTICPVCTGVWRACVMLSQTCFLMDSTKLSLCRKGRTAVWGLKIDLAASTGIRDNEIETSR